MRRHLSLSGARFCAENVDQPVHVTGDVVPRGIELEIHQALGLLGLAAFHAAANLDGDAVGEFELVEDAPDVVGGGRIGGQHVAQRTLGGVVLSLHLLDRFLGLIGIGGRIIFVDGDAERFACGFGLGEREARRRQMAREGGVEPVELVEAFEAEPIGCNRQKAEPGNEQDGLGRDRKMQEFQIGHDGEAVVMRVSTEQEFPSA